MVSFDSIPENYRFVAKELLWAVDQTASYGRRRASSPGTAKTILSIFRHLARHLAGTGATSLASATKVQIEVAHLNYCGLLNGAPITAGRAAKYMSVLGQLYSMGPECHKLISDGLSFDPNSLTLSVGRGRSLKSSESTPELSEETGRKLMLMALDWVENKTDATLWIVNAHKTLSQVKSKTKHAQKSQAYALRAIREYIATNPGFIAELIQARSVMGQGPLTSFLSKRQPALPAGATDLEADCLALGLIAQQVQLTFQGFCYVVCAGFNGWRANEIFSIDSQSLKETPAGHTLSTKVRKTAINPNAATERPVPPIVAQAVLSLAKLNESSAWRPTMHSQPISEVERSEVSDLRGQASAKEEGDERPEAVGGTNAESESIFRSSSGSLIDTNDMSNRITAAWRHFTGSDERITTHQFRRFFALFYLRRYQGNLDAIRRHFRHVSRDMVWAYVKDGLNADYLTREKKSLASEIARSVVFDQGYASTSVGKELKEIRTTLTFQGKTLSVEDAAAYLTQQIETAFVDIHAMEWGYCLLQSGQFGAACEGKAGPIEARSEPQTCGRCKFLCTGTESVPFWQQSALLHQEILRHPKIVPIMREQSERALATAANILARHACEPSSGENP